MQQDTISWFPAFGGTVAKISIESHAEHSRQITSHCVLVVGHPIFAVLTSRELTCACKQQLGLLVDSSSSAPFVCRKRSDLNLVIYRLLVLKPKGHAVELEGVMLQGFSPALAAAEAAVGDALRNA